MLDKLMMLKSLPYVATAKLHVALAQSALVDSIKKTDLPKTTTTSGGMSSTQIQQLFSGDGAASSGQALSSVKDATTSWGQGFTSIAQTAFVFIAVLAIIVGAAGLIFHSNKSQELAEDKKGMGVKILAIIIGSASIAIVIFLFGIGNGTATAAKS